MLGFLFQVFLLFIILIGTGVYLQSLEIIIVIIELIIITSIQLFTNAIKSKEFNFLFMSSILFLFLFVFLQKNILDKNKVKSLLILLIFYVNWYYLTYVVVNLVN